MHMSRKIVAIGGGGNGRVDDKGRKHPYELEKQDSEIIRLTGKPHPNFLFLAHAQPLERQEGYFQVMKAIYGDRFGCACRDLKSSELSDTVKVQEYMDWADIIYVGGGDTHQMLGLWKESALDVMLRRAWMEGKVMCGVSAGANCWFQVCLSDYLRMRYGMDQPLTDLECLGFVRGMFVPHCEEEGRLESLKQLLREKDMVGIAVSNCAALEIVDDSGRLITGDAADKELHPYGVKAFWKDGAYIEERIEDSFAFKPLQELMSMKKA